MTVFKAFLHVLNKCKGMVILYTALLLLFGGINAKAGIRRASSPQTSRKSSL